VEEKKETLYWIGSRLAYRNSLRRMILLVGRYSLLSYLAQILFLQILFRLSGGEKVSEGGAFYVVIMTSVFVFLVCKGTAFCCEKYAHVDKAYRLVFG